MPVANLRIRRVGLTPARPAGLDAPVRRDRGGTSLDSPYLRLLAGWSSLVAIATQWTSLQLGRRRQAALPRRARRTSPSSTARSASSPGVVQLPGAAADHRARCFARGAVGRDPRAAAGAGLRQRADPPGAGVLERAAHQRLRSGPAVLGRQGDLRAALSADRARRPARSIKNAIDIVVNRIADAVGAVLLGLATDGFLVLPGLGISACAAPPRSTLVTVGVWIVAGLAAPVGIHPHHSGQHPPPPAGHRARHRGGDRAVGGRRRCAAKLAAADLSEVRYALDLIEGQRTRKWHPALRDAAARIRTPTSGGGRWPS